MLEKSLFITLKRPSILSIIFMHLMLIFNQHFISPKTMWTFLSEDLVNFQPCLFLKWTFFAIAQGEKLVVIRLKHTWSSFK